MSTIKIGIVGVGVMGKAHLAAIQQMREVEVAWLCDSDGDALDELKDGARAIPKATDYRSLVESEIDGVLVATPEAYHVEPVTDFLRAGKHVFVEKPLATDAEGARAMAAEAERAQRLLMPGMNLRYEPRFRMVRDWIAEGAHGGVVSMYFRRNRPAPLFERYSRVHPAFETGSHDVDLALWFAQDRIARVVAVQRQRDGEANPFGIWALAEFASGAIACFETVWLLPPESRVERDDVAEVIGRTGTARVDIANPGIDFLDHRGRYSRDPIFDPNSLRNVSLSVSFELAEFISALRDEPIDGSFSLADAVHGIEVIEAMISSARTGQPVEVEGRVTV